MRVGGWLGFRGLTRGEIRREGVGLPGGPVACWAEAQWEGGSLVLIFFVFLLSFNFFPVYFIFQIVLVL